MTDLRTAAQQALEALKMMRDEYGEANCPACDHADAAIYALKDALAEPDRAQKMRDAGYTRRPTLREMAEPTTEDSSAVEPVQEPVAGNWSVFNTGAEVFSGMSLPEAVAELTPARLERGWSAVCVINKDNPPTYAPPQRKPLTEEEKRALADKLLSCQPESYEVSGVFDLISAVEVAHGIK